MYPVVRKKCDYKDCGEFRNKNHVNENVKFFSFPSDQERRKKWIELSQTESETPRFICSKHFEKIYLSYSSRRVHLVTSAVPIAYKTVNSLFTDIKDNNKVQVPDVVIGSLISEFIDEMGSDEIKEDNLQNSETKSERNDQPKAKILNSLTPVTFRGKKIEISPVCSNNKKQVYPKKIKLVKLDSSKIKRLYKTNINEKSEKQQNREKNSGKNELEGEKMNFGNANQIENDVNKNANKVKTVLMYGEEYIQMPKSLYIKERMDLLNQIENYKSILKDFKDKLDDLDFS